LWRYSHANGLTLSVSVSRPNQRTQTNKYPHTAANHYTRTHAARSNHHHADRYRDADPANAHTATGHDDISSASDIDICSHSCTCHSYDRADKTPSYSHKRAKRERMPFRLCCGNAAGGVQYQRQREQRQGENISHTRYARLQQDADQAGRR
jgi:hypothetical protein